MNLCPLVVVKVPVTLVNPDVVIAPADALLVISIIIEQEEAGGASVCAPPLV